MKLDFSCSASFCATRRPSVSALPPGWKGTMILTGLVGHACAAKDKTKNVAAVKKRIIRQFYNRPHERSHRHPYAHRPREISFLPRQAERRAVAVDGGRRRLPQARDDLRQALPHGGRRILERAAAHRGDVGHARQSPGDLADARASLLLAAAR